METAQLILEIFWMVWIPWMILFFGSMALAHFGYPKLHHFILKYLYYFSKEDRDDRRLRKEAKIRMYGTNEEKVSLHNKLNPYYQMMTDSEVFEKYEGIDRNKINIVPVPTFLLDTRTNSLYDNRNEIDSIRKQLDDNVFSMIVPQPKEWVKLKSVQIYNGMNVDEVNKSEKIFIFPQKCENYRFVTI
tara:strand:+ start:44 stop:607 length:564 start_codon:yes stop_codon:yes gene_type:complete